MVHCVCWIFGFRITKGFVYSRTFIDLNHIVGEETALSSINEIL